MYLQIRIANISFYCTGRVAANESLLYYVPGSSDTSSDNPSYEPIFELPYVDPATTQMCGGNEQCIYDYILTRRRALALGSAAAVEQHDDVVEASTKGEMLSIGKRLITFERTYKMFTEYETKGTSSLVS